MREIVERLDVAVEQLNQVRRSIESEGHGYRLNIALQALKSAIALLERAGLSGNGQSSAGVEGPDGMFPISVIWERPRKGQRFEAQLLRDGRIRLSNGRGPFAPARACIELVGGSFAGWRDWKYFDEADQKWLPIAQLRAAGYFD